MTAHILTSYAFFKNVDMSALVRSARADVPVDLLADSGAFTAYSTGKEVTVKGYAAWLTAWAPYIQAAITLDVIGGTAAQTAANTAALEDAMGDAVRILPVFHVGNPWPELERLCATHPYICLGGAVGILHRDRAFMTWLVRCHRIARDHGTVLHGLGMTKPPIPERLPWFSTDSSFWSSASRTGTLNLFDPRGGRFRPAIRVGSRQVYDKGCADLVRSYGMDPARLTTPGFGRVGERGAAGRDERNWLIDACVETWLRYADHVRTIRPPVPPPPGMTGDGPKVFLAASDKTSFRRIAEAAARHHAQAVPA